MCKLVYLVNIQKAYDTLWQDVLWLKLWDIGVKGKMWFVVKGNFKLLCC